MRVYPAHHEEDAAASLSLQNNAPCKGLVMEKFEWEHLINEKYRSFKSSFEELEQNFLLTINNVEVYFSRAVSDDAVPPDAWLERRHANGSIHEPRMVSWLFALAEVSGAAKVRFYDVGALFGYHSFIASERFENCEIVAVEGNVNKANYIENSAHSCARAKFAVEKCVVDKSEFQKLYLIDGYAFYPLFGSGFTRRLKGKLNNRVNRLLNLAGGNRPVKKEPIIRRIKSKTLTSILRPRAEVDVEILKIDAEGYQSFFLPPAASELIERNAIVLLELDDPGKMRRFRTTNDELVQPFVQNGYAAIWVDHRNPDSDARAVTSIEGDLDRNSLVALIPKQYVK